MGKVYTKEELEQILKMALDSKANKSGVVDYENLLEIARELNIDENAVKNAISKMETKNNISLDKTKYIQNRRRKFFNHLKSYIIVNTALILMDFFMSGGLTWAYFPVLGWGIGLAFDAFDKLSFDEEKFEQSNRKFQKKHGN
jgi:energy-converting hydrogenase A subunit M